METIRDSLQLWGVKGHFIWPAEQMRSLMDFLYSRWSTEEEEQLHMLAFVFSVLAIISAVVLLGVTPAGYGRYSPGCSPLYGFKMNAKFAWVVMEVPNLVMGVSNILSARTECLKSLVFMLAAMFCVFNGYSQTRMLTHVRVYDQSWLMDPRFCIGILMFFGGMFINVHADSILRNLRKPGESGYKIPQGGAFRYVSGANFFGEIVEWAGFALATWSWTSFAFAFFTLCNIGPRGYNHHLWYKATFKASYPKSRRAVIPFIW